MSIFIFPAPPLRALLPVSVACFAALSAVPANSQCQLAKLIAASGTENDQFGRDVAVSDGVVMVGMPGDDVVASASGAVYVYLRGNDWNPSQILRPDSADYTRGLGHSVAVSSSYAVIGAPISDVFAERSGAAYIYSNGSGGWSLVQELLPSDGDEYDLFGSDVAISGERVLISAPRDEPGYAGSGYIFERDDNGQWIEVAKLQSHDLPFGNEMGYAVGLEGSIAVLTTWEDDEEGFGAGAAYVFESDSEGNWRQTAKLLADNGRPFDAFGIAMAIGEEQIMVGAPNAQGATPHSGAVYLFERDGMGGWIQTQRIQAIGGQEWDYFGGGIAMDGDLAVIGASGVDDGGEHAGSAYVFTKGADGSWSQISQLWPDDPEPYRYFGVSAVALSSHTAVFGCFRDTPYGELSGSAYVFGIGPDSDGDGETDSCACIGDLDGDRVVGLNDFATMLSNYRHRNGSGATYEDGDLDGDGDVDLSDVSQMLFRYGAECW